MQSDVSVNGLGSSGSGGGIGSVVSFNGSSNIINCGGGRSAIRPTDLPTENRRWIRHRKLHIVSPHLHAHSQKSSSSSSSKIVAQSFPTPMEEPKKVMRAQYVGAAEVQQATGMDVLNAAIEHLAENVPAEQFEVVNVSVAPSMISINNVSGKFTMLGQILRKNLKKNLLKGNPANFTKKSSKRKILQKINRA